MNTCDTTAAFLKDQAGKTLNAVAADIEQLGEFKGYLRTDHYLAVKLQRCQPHKSGISLWRMVTISVFDGYWAVHMVDLPKAKRQAVLNVLADHGIHRVLCTNDGKQYGLVYKEVSGGKLTWRRVRPYQACGKPLWQNVKQPNK